MITVTVGTIPFQFDRIIQWLETLLETGSIVEEVYVQYGVSNISRIEKHPLVKVAPTLEREKLFDLVKNSRLVISHAGQGSTRWLSACKASFVIVPRLAQHREHIDDHQLSFAKSVEALGVRYCVYREELESYILNPPAQAQGDLFSDLKLVDYLLQTYLTGPIPDELNKPGILLKGIST
ncbi:MAG: glycosyltransferase, partial [Kovacikia sp.]